MAKAFFPAILWLIVITFLSTKGGVSMPTFNLFQTDKLAHAAAYFLLTWLILWGFSRWRHPQRVQGMHTLSAVLFAALFGALMEYVQFKFFPDRRFEYDDMLANTFGAMLGWLFFARVFNGHRPSKS